MFRQEEIYVGGWKEKTLEAMQKRRFELAVSQLPPLGMNRLDALSPQAFERRIEQCWQDIERKPMRTQQTAEIWKKVLTHIERQADFLSYEEHELVERALILGGSAQIDDAVELEAARALSRRLWANLGVVSGKPYVELEAPVIRPAAKAFARSGHEEIRRQLDEFGTYVSNMLYRLGVMDDRLPQQMLLRDMFGGIRQGEMMIQLARQYLWASYDCIDYGSGVMLVHPAFADPRHLIVSCRRKSDLSFTQTKRCLQMDILPEEIPLQQNLERAIASALRDGYQPHEVVRTIRFLCKQGAPLQALQDVLQTFLIVCVSCSMRGALERMYYAIPKWIECAENEALQ